MNGHTPTGDAELQPSLTLDALPHDAHDIDPENASEPSVCEIETPESSAPSQVVSPVIHPGVRPDLQNQKITNENAQSYFSPRFCVFIGKSVVSSGFQP